MIQQSLHLYLNAVRDYEIKREKTRELDRSIEYYNRSYHQRGIVNELDSTPHRHEPLIVAAANYVLL